MSLSEKAMRLVEDYALLPDPSERFQYLIEQSSEAPGLPLEDRLAEHRVDGCVSMVWLIAEERNGCIHYRCDGDAPIVKALAWVLSEFYSGASAEEIVATPPTFFERLGLDRALTESRRRGLQALIERFQALAKNALKDVPKKL